MLRLVHTNNAHGALRHYTPTTDDGQHTGVMAENLSVGAQLTLWSMRRWIQSRQEVASHKHLEEQNVIKRLKGPYQQAGIPSALDFFDECMTLLSKIAIRQVTFECPCKAALNTDELRILNTFVFSQNGELNAAKLKISRLISGRLRDIYCRSATQYTNTLKRAGLPLQLHP